MAKKRNAKLPKTVKIGCSDFTVVRVVDLHDRDNGKRKALNGHITWDDCMIRVERRLARSRERVVIMHEIIHGVLEHAAHPEQDEALIDVLAHGLLAVLRDNPRLIRYLAE